MASSLGGYQKEIKRLCSNVYPLRVDDTVIVHKYIVSVERQVIPDKGPPTFTTIKPGGPESLKIIQSGVFKAIIIQVEHALRRLVHSDLIFMFDGQDTIYCNKEINESSLKEASIMRIQVDDLDKTLVWPDYRQVVLRDSQVLRVTLKPDGGFSNIPAAIRECDREDPLLTKFFSVLSRAAAPSKFVANRRKLYDTDTLTEVRQGMQRMEGIRMGNKLTAHNILSVAIDVDVTEGVFFKPLPLLEAIQCYFNRANPLLMFNNRWEAQRVERFGRGVVVREEGTDRVFAIAGLKWSDEPYESRLPTNWTLCAPTEALKAKYGYVPVILDDREGAKCHALTSLQLMPYSKVPLEKQDGVKKPPILQPDVRFQKMNKARREIRIDNGNEFLRGFGTQISANPILPVAERIAAPAVYGSRNGQRSPLQVEENRQFDSSRTQFVAPASIAWLEVVYDKREFRAEADPVTVQSFLDKLKRGLEVKGVTIQKWQITPMERDDWKAGTGLQEHLARRKRERDSQVENGLAPTAILVLIGFEHDHEFLKYAEHGARMIVQHVMKRTAMKVAGDTGFKSLSGILLKLNEKSGGANIEIVGPPVCSSLFPQRDNPASLIIGIDVCHGDPLPHHLEKRGVQPDPSIIGLSSNASNRHSQQFTGSFIPTTGRREAVPAEVMREYGSFLAQQYMQNHKCRPSNVIVVRDGVSRSQYGMAEEEFSHLMEGVCEAVPDGKYKPRSILVIVTKRHNLRLYDEKNGTKISPAAGTVVDNGVVSPFLPEFLMVPQDAFHGTADPALVTVLLDGGKTERKNYPQAKFNELKHLVHSLCFLHGVSDKPIGLPEPLQVAHDLAERGAKIAKAFKRMKRINDPRYQLNVNDLKEHLEVRGTHFHGIKFTA